MIVGMADEDGPLEDAGVEVDREVGANRRHRWVASSSMTRNLKQREQVK